jgi:predicted metal-dependent hydrolase
VFKKFFVIKIRKRIKRRIRRKKKNNSTYLTHKSQALYLAKVRLEHFNQFYNFKYNKVTIRNQISRWGSCSKRGNLNFNYRIALLPEELRDYIIVHELCHLGEFNHSKNFWALVEKTIPNWSELRKKLKIVVK